ncbi:MAG: alpha amylase C-terminal domain-containing protein [Lachnospiraceae bacterium]|nr:alpha amylase C-terminal domain-containing protein [Lachnospiraceae bacterium]
MDNKLYKLMNWPEIESIVYSECDHPQEILGMHSVNGGFLIQAFFPGRDEMSVYSHSSEKYYEMELVDEAGFFAVFVSAKAPFSYEYITKNGSGDEVRFLEVYSYIPKFWLNLKDKLLAGVFYDSYKYFGAHFCERKEVLGTEFMTYAPHAERVSVVGDFNGWDGRAHQMCKIDDSGIFALFIPGVSIGSLYKFEVKLTSGLTFIKRDPFAFSVEKGIGDACRVIEDPDWERIKIKRTPMGDSFAILNMSLRDAFMNRDKESVTEYIIDMVHEYSYDAVLFEDFSYCDNRSVTEWGKLSFYSVCPEVCRLKELIEIIDALHKAGIKVLSTIDVSSFLPDDGGLRGYDGTRIFEGDNTETLGRLSFDFENLYVRNYLISVCDYFVRVLSLDGIAVGGLDRILYLDYGKGEGEWRPNIYGGNESIGGHEFIKHLNSLLHKNYSNICTIARDSMVSNNLTLSLEEDGLGFDFKLHTQFDKDLFNYLKNDYSERKFHHSELTYSPVYIYCEKFILSFMYSDYGKNKERLFNTLPGDTEQKAANMRLALAYLFTHPGRKCLSFSDFTNLKSKVLLKELIELYKNHPALNSLDDESEGFKWVNAIDSEHSVISFERTSGDETFLVVVNFSDKTLNYKLGVDDGTYKEIFASEQIKFGGMYKLSGRAKESKAAKRGGKPHELTLKLCPLCLHIYEKCPCQNKEDTL